MTITPPDPSALLMGGGTRSAKFEKVGDSVKGEITSVETKQQTDLDGAPKTWDNGDPMWQVVVTLATAERDADDPDDDGKRAVYLKGSNKYASTSKAVADAVRAAGASKLEVGGTLALQYTGDGEATKRGFSPPKLYAAAYKAPVAGVDLGNLLGDDGF
jgi:hypothetical protein